MFSIIKKIFKTITGSNSESVEGLDIHKNDPNMTTPVVIKPAKKKTKAKIKKTKAE